jgi:hypothetical protein
MEPEKRFDSPQFFWQWARLEAQVAPTALAGPGTTDGFGLETLSGTLWLGCGDVALCEEGLEEREVRVPMWKPRLPASHSDIA